MWHPTCGCSVLPLAFHRLTAASPNVSYLVFSSLPLKTRHVKGILPLVGPDDTFNIHPMLLGNIAKSPYFQKCCEKLTDWNMLVDEIYYEVKHMEPWTAGALASSTV